MEWWHNTSEHLQGRVLLELPFGGEPARGCGAIIRILIQCDLCT